MPRTDAVRCLVGISQSVQLDAEAIRASAGASSAECVPVEEALQRTNLKIYFGDRHVQVAHVDVPAPIPDKTIARTIEKLGLWSGAKIGSAAHVAVTVHVDSMDLGNLVVNALTDLLPVNFVYTPAFDDLHLIKIPRKPKKLSPQGDFFQLFDGRGESDILVGQFDGDPERSAASSEARGLQCQLFAPGRDLSMVENELFDNPASDWDPSWISATSHFSRGAPKRMPHYIPVLDFGCAPARDVRSKLKRRTNLLRMTISPEWKAAIEDLEPGVHDFYRHELRFTDGSVSDRYIFRNGQALNLLQMEDSIRNRAVAVTDSLVGRLQYSILPGVAGLVARRSVVEGRHWLMHPGFNCPFVSRELAEALFPLLPKNVRLVPVAV